MITVKAMRDCLEEKVPNKARQLRNINKTPVVYAKSGAEVIVRYKK